MSEKILNASYKFTCDACVTFPTPFIIANDMQQKGIETNGGNILTANAKCTLAVPVLCKNNLDKNTGAPLSCMLISPSHLAWENTNQTFLLNGINTLSQNSSCTCTLFGGKICTKLASSTSKIAKGLVSANISNSSIDSSFKSCVSESNCISENPDAVLPFNIDESQPILKGDLTKTTNTPTVTAVDTNQKYEDTTKTPQKREYMLCDYMNCVQWEDCEYYHADILINNNSESLKNNYKSQMDTPYNKYIEKEKECLELLYPSGFTNAAHHLIPGHQCLMPKNETPLRYGILIRLANYFQYDINNEFNCILLPTHSKDSKKDANQKLRAASFDVMGVMGAQWHSGGHKYNIDKDTLKNIKSYYERYPSLYVNTDNSAYFQNYGEYVNLELDKLLNIKYSKKSVF